MGKNSILQIFHIFYGIFIVFIQYLYSKVKRRKDSTQLRRNLPTTKIIIENCMQQIIYIICDMNSNKILLKKYEMYKNNYCIYYIYTLNEKKIVNLKLIEFDQFIVYQQSSYFFILIRQQNQITRCVQKTNALLLNKMCYTFAICYLEIQMSKVVYIFIIQCIISIKIYKRQLIHGLIQEQIQKSNQHEPLIQITQKDYLSCLHKVQQVKKFSLVVSHILSTKKKLKIKCISENTSDKDVGIILNLGFCNDYRTNTFYNLQFK
eukprot:TRINITY_DN1130_c1_g1_i1.p1 TRINITY_DN1130_c1_g1~~TRINITY_DN1130_c1_g1_i1.p1  ORF type:complete len:263 (-),score=-27.84 TRINITY_DN1130_c1_g1_i1:388-1176(-)